MAQVGGKVYRLPANHTGQRAKPWDESVGQVATVAEIGSGGQSSPPKVESSATSFDATFPVLFNTEAMYLDRLSARRE